MTKSTIEMTYESKIKPETDMLDRMVNMGFDLKAIEVGMKENWGGIMKDEMFLTPFKGYHEAVNGHSASL